MRRMRCVQMPFHYVAEASVIVPSQPYEVLSRKCVYVVAGSCMTLLS